MALCVRHFTATSPVHGTGLYTPRPEAANAGPSDQLVHEEVLIVATRAISAGEELLIHTSSDADYFRKMGLGRGGYRLVSAL